MKPVPKIAASLFLAILFISLTVGCSPAPEKAPPPKASAPAAEAQVIRWKGEYCFPSVVPYGPFNQELTGLNAMYRLWTNWLTKATGGRLVIEWTEPGAIFPITDADLAVGKGTVQIAASSGLYYRGRFPEGDIESGGLFFFRTESEAYEAFYYYGLWEALNELYSKMNLVYFPIHGDSSIGIGTRFDAPTLASIKGKKIRAVGIQGDYIALLGGSPSAIPLGETYQAMKLGTVDGWVAAAGLFEANKYNEVTKGFVLEPRPSSSIVNVIINKDAFNALPKDIQDILMRDSRYAGFAAATTWRNQNNYAIERAQREFGLKLYRWSDADQAKAIKMVQDTLWPKMAAASPGCAQLMDIIMKQQRAYGRIK